MRQPWRRVFVAGIAVAVAAVVVALTTSGGRKAANPQAQPSQTQPPAPRPRPPGQRLGASVNILFNTPGAFSPAQIDAQLRALQATGATIARSDALWEMVEPSPPSGGVHHYLWGFDDRIAGSLAAHGLQWLPIVDYSAPWAAAPSGGTHPPPSSPRDFAAFAAALAARYGPSGWFWRSHPELTPTPVDTYEIWNEPDNPMFWSPAPDPVRYAQLYEQARVAIDDVDGRAHVIIGGLTHFEASLPALVAAAPELRGHVDGVAIHPYASSPKAVLARVRGARRVLESLGLGEVPLYVTEFGWTTQPVQALNWASASRRPDYIAQTLGLLGHADCNVAAIVLYTWVSLERDPSNGQDWYGIHSPLDRGSVDSDAFADGIRRADAHASLAQAC